jgi:hypothetical protein
MLLLLLLLPPPQPIMSILLIRCRLTMQARVLSSGAKVLCCTVLRFVLL